MFDHYRVLYGKAVYGEEEIQAVVDVLKNHPLCDGPSAALFESEIASLFGKSYGVFVNSASSGLEIVMRSLELPDDAEVLTPACTFGTSYRSILAAGYRPRLVDVEIGTYVPSIQAIEAAVTNKTKAVLIPHLIGSIPDLVGIKELCTRHNLLFIEDSADQIGGKFLGLPTGVYSDASIASFYASHHITACGIGGMVCVDSKDWQVKLQAYRDWGRQFVSDKDQNRYTTLHGVVYDKKFIHYMTTGNYKCNEVSAAFGLAQLKKLGEFTKKRQDAFKRVYDCFAKYEDLFYLPKSTPGAEFTWMSFPITIKCGIDRHEFACYLENNKIQTRPLFSGNILYHPVAKGHDENASDFPNSCYIFANSLLLGCHHGMTEEEMDYLTQAVDRFLAK